MPENSLNAISWNDDETEAVVAEAEVQFLVFLCGSGLYGVDLLKIHEILKPLPVTRLPNVEEEVLGVINLRGNIIPVLDVLKTLRHEYAELHPTSRIVVCSVNDKSMGLLVDAVVEVVSLKESSIEGAELRGFSQEYLSGVGRTSDFIFLIFNLALLFKDRVAESEANLLEEGGEV
ncbi:chemotaxis protein CheW [Leptonema illini]|uniref:chemotaxis protein CheW n=1 Tax=Leptonema illini TaxID=183 RepID=UPI000991430A|nr:chemotaxis protein CheW [Leptonema illini]